MLSMSASRHANRTSPRPENRTRTRLSLFAVLGFPRPGCIRSGQARRSAVSSGPHVTTIIFQGGEIGRDRQFRVGTRERGAIRFGAISSRSQSEALVEGKGGLPPGVGPAGHDHRRDPRVRRADPAGGARRLALGQPDAWRWSCCLTTLAIRTPQEFSAFPTILLTTTLTRLVLERRDDPAGADPRRRGRARGGRRRDPGVRRVRGRRPGDRRRDPVLDPGRDPVRGDHPGGDPDQRGGRAVHARRAARPADGDRCRPARRADRPARGPPPPRGGLSPGGLLRGHGRGRASSSAATRSPAS